MTRQPYFIGDSFNSDFIDSFKSYLDHKEEDLCRDLMALSFCDLPPVLSPPFLHLIDTIEEFKNRVERYSQLPKKMISKEEWGKICSGITDTLWKYIEVLEEGTLELFQQVNQLNVELWDSHLLDWVAAIKEMLMHRMDDLLRAIRQLDHQLRNLKRICLDDDNNYKFWHKMGFQRQTILDPSMESSLTKSQKYLTEQYHKFNEKYKGYHLLLEKVEPSLKKFHNYRRLATLELDLQNHIKTIYQQLKIMDFNYSLKAISPDEINNMIENLYSPERILFLFHEYFLAIKKGLYDKSRMIKKKFREVFNDFQAREPIIHNVTGYLEELDLLRWLCIKYQMYLLESSKSMISSHLKIFKKDNEQNSKFVNQLKTQLLEVEDLNTQCKNFQKAMQKENVISDTFSTENIDKTANYLNEMIQLLSSKKLIYRNAEEVLNILKDLNELSTFDPEVVNYTCKTFCRLMRADWKYHVLQEIPQFHLLYDIHHGIVGPLEERKYANRLNKFKHLLDQLNQWISNKELIKHAHDADLIINDIKAYLQDFFASIQGLKNLNEKNNSDTVSKSIQKAYEAVLEYYFVFSKFFYHLSSEVPEEKLLRKQFLFVDQYLEAIENRLEDIRSVA